MTVRVGLGYDVHRFVKGRKLFLGGVEIPYTYGLEGHSDADAVLHSLCDAIIGALAKGDIGEHFPNTDPKYKDIQSTKLLEKVIALMKEERFSIGNIDLMILAQEPQIKQFKQKMVETIAGICGVDTTSVNVKATTNEGMGFVGRKEGVACYATVSLRPEDTMTEKRGGR